MMAPTKYQICNGWKAHDFALRGVDGKTYSLADARGPKGLLVVFICNHCPFVNASIGRMRKNLSRPSGQSLFPMLAGSMASIACRRRCRRLPDANSITINTRSPPVPSDGQWRSMPTRTAL
jgi:hypothetical protein